MDKFEALEEKINVSFKDLFKYKFNKEKDKQNDDNHNNQNDELDK